MCTIGNTCFLALGGVLIRGEYVLPKEFPPESLLFDKVPIRLPEELHDFETFIDPRLLCP